MKRFLALSLILVVTMLTARQPAAAQEPARHDLPVQASKVTLEAKDKPLSEVLAEFARQSGNAPLVVPADLKDLHVTVQLKDTPYWEALDALCESAGLLYVPDFERSVLRIDKALKREDHGARAQGIVVKVEEMRRLGSYRVTPALRTLYNDAPWLRRNNPTPAQTCWVLRYFWEDRLPVLEATAEIDEIIDAAGNALGVFQVPDPTPYRVHFTRGSQPPSGTLNFYLAPVPERVDKLGEIKGVVRLSLGIGRKELVLENVLERTGQDASLDGLTLLLRKAERQKEVVRMTVEVGIEDSRTQSVLEADGPSYGFHLEGPKGTRTPCTIEHMTRDFHAMKRDPGPSAVPRQLNGTITLELTCRPTDQQPGICNLVYVMPEEIHSEEIPFEIAGVPVR